MSRIKKGDEVVVLAGRDKGKRGTVLRRVDADHVVVEGVNMRKKHSRPSQKNPDGGILTFEGPIHISNVMLIDPSSGEPTRVRARIDDDGTRERIAVKSGNPIPRPRNR